MEDETRMEEEQPREEEQPPEGKARISRKRFLGTVAGASVGTLALGGVLAACGGGGDEEAAATEAATAEAATTEAAATTAAGEAAGAAGQPILIGSAYPTVNSPADAEQMERGSGLARQEINDAGGVAGRPIEQEIVDMNSFDGESLTSAFNDLVSKEPDAVILGYHNVAGPNDILAAYGAPYLNASTADWQVTELKSNPQKFKNIFQADPTEVPYGLGFPPFLNALIDQGLFNPAQKTIYIIEGDIVYGQTIAAACEEAAPGAGWEIVGKDPVDTAGGTAPVADWTPFIDKVRDSGATATFNTHWNPADHAAFMKAWVADPPDSFVYLQYGASVPEFLELAGDAAEGAVWATVLGTMNDPVGLAFQERYQAMWDAPAGFSNAGTGYDEVYMLAHAWGITGDPRNFEANITELKRNIHRGVSGGYWFGHDEANYCLSYPSEIQDPSLGNPHLFFQILPDDGGNLSHQIIDPAPYIQTQYAKQPWLST
jgi:branched-chain amino acid transport system substrate-binding protein